MKFLLVIKICSALHGDCLPEQNVNTHDSWFNCAKSGVYETLGGLPLQLSLFCSIPVIIHFSIFIF